MLRDSENGTLATVAPDFLALRVYKTTSFAIDYRAAGIPDVSLFVPSGNYE